MIPQLVRMRPRAIAARAVVALPMLFFPIIMVLVDIFPILRRFYVRYAFELSEEVRTIRYIDRTEDASDTSSESRNQRARQPTILVSTESDNRYEWIENFLKNEGHNWRIVYMPNLLFELPFTCLLGRFRAEWPTLTLIDWDYVDECKAQFERGRRRLRAHLRKILTTIDEEYSPSAFVSASVNDMRWLETIGVARSLGHRWVVTEREGVLTPAVIANDVDVVRKDVKPNIDMMLVANGTHRDFWRAVGMDPSRICVSGDLKTDIWRYPHIWPSRSAIHPWLQDDRCLIVYFSFGARYYIEPSHFPDLDGDWSDLQSAHYRVIRRMAEKYDSSVQIVVKSSARASDLNNNSDFSDLHNVIVLRTGGLALDLIICSDIVVGFQSTATIEAMFTDKPILYPAWGEVYNKVADFLIPIHTSTGVNWLHSEKEFEENLEELIQFQEKRKLDRSVIIERKNFREKYYFLPQEGVASVTWSKILECIEQQQEVSSKPLRSELLCGEARLLSRDV